jgi:hypothetical protein
MCWGRGAWIVSISKAIRQYALALTQLHTDSTTLKVYGAYARDEREEGTVVTYGDSRDHRPDLKQLLCGLTATAEGVLVWGHITNSNQSNSTEHRFHITQLRQHLPDLGEPLLVADSKFFAGDAIALAAAHRFRFITLLPQTVGLRQELIDDPTLRDLLPLWERPGRRKGERQAYHGAPVVRPYLWKTAAGEVQELPLRLLVVESTQLAKAKASQHTPTDPGERVVGHRDDAVRGRGRWLGVHGSGPGLGYEYVRGALCLPPLHRQAWAGRPWRWRSSASGLRGPEARVWA